MSLTTGLVALGIWIIFFWFYRSYSIDAYRQRLFALRDSLWDYAAAGHVSFDGPAYRLVRDRMNGLIRFAHLLSATWVIAVLVVERWRPSPEIHQELHRELAEALDKLARPVADQLRAYHQRALMLAIEHLVLVSPVFWACVVPVVLVVVIRLAWIKGTALIDRIPWTAELVDSEAARLGAAG